MRRVPISRLRPGGLYAFAPPDGAPSFAAVFTREPREGENPYTHVGSTLRVRGDQGDWIPWLLLDVRSVSFLISPAQGRKTIASRTMRITLHHISTSEGSGWIELLLSPLASCGHVMCLSGLPAFRRGLPSQASRRRAHRDTQ